MEVVETAIFGGAEKDEDEPLKAMVGWMELKVLHFSVCRVSMGEEPSEWRKKKRGFCMWNLKE